MTSTSRTRDNTFVCRCSTLSMYPDIFFLTFERQAMFGGRIMCHIENFSEDGEIQCWRVIDVVRRGEQALPDSMGNQITVRDGPLYCVIVVHEVGLKCRGVGREIRIGFFGRVVG
jgi:hypothetical protein